MKINLNSEAEEKKGSLMFNIKSRRILWAGVLPVVLTFMLVANSRSDGGPGDSGTVTATLQSSVNWEGDGTAGGAAGEDNCADVLTGERDLNCDQFELTVAPGNYSGKNVKVEIHWTVPATDYDLYIHKGDVNGPLVASSGNGAPSTSEIAFLDPAATGAGLYTVHVVYFSAFAGDQYSGSATTLVKPASRSANYISGAKISPPLAFSPNKPLKAPVTNSDGEPSSRTDFQGNSYHAGIRGFPAGVDLWYYDFRPNSATYDPKARNPIYRFQPDGFSPDNRVALGGDGGGDIDLAVGYKAPGAGQPPFLAFSSLIAANLSVGNSTDRAQTYVLNPAGSSVPVDDREWHGAYGANAVYMLYRTDAPVVGFIQRSNDGGVTYPITTSVGPTTQTGGIDVNQKTGTVYASFTDGSVYVGEDPEPDNPLSTGPLTYTKTQATPTTDVRHIFCTVKVAEGTSVNPDGVVYLAYSDDHDVFLVHSNDKGKNWTTPVRVSNLPGGGTNIFPWIEVGSGSRMNSVGVVWYGTTSDINDDSANWKAYYAFTRNATAAHPTFTQAEASDHFIHASNISEGGLTGTANRNLLDYFQVSFDPKGAAVISYTDDHNDFNGNLYATRQISGPSIKGGNVPAAAEGNLVRESNPDVQPPAQPGPNGEQVTDFEFDVGYALLARVPRELYLEDSTNGSVDIRTIKYSSGRKPGIGDYIEVTMHTGDIDPTAEVTWRMNFSVNAPDARLSASKNLTNKKSDYTYGLSDRGDQFFVRATAVAPGRANRSYKYGTAVRDSDGGITYKTVGDADFGQILFSNTDTITIQISWAKLNAILAKNNRPLIGHGTTLVGLRGQAFTASGLFRQDDTYGGTQYTIP